MCQKRWRAGASSAQSRNFFWDYQPVVDSWHLFDNTGSKPVTIAFRTGSKRRISNRGNYHRLIKRYDTKDRRS